MKFGYYPGCSLGSTARPYDLSTRAIAEPFGLELVEVEDWNCCGSMEYFAVNASAGYALVGRNLALAAGQDVFTKLVAPCSACYLNLRKVDKYLGQYPEVKKRTDEALAVGGLSYKPGSLDVRHLIDVIVHDVGFKAIADKVTNPLKGLRLAPYYGCLIARPDLGQDSALDDAEYPTHMDKLLDVLGATVIDFPLKTHCCGGHMTQVSAETGYEMIRQLLKNASEYEADAIVTLCPMCQLNLDAYQSNINKHFGTSFKLPILYFTQMIGLAIGLTPKELGLGKEIVSSAPMLEKIGTELETEPELRGRKKKDDKSLPMPNAQAEG
ncbi:MAG: CoB--CoM heterodisulfide reductase iron-sulfur subunit B family protein [Anaerolineales bacterium]|nr:CoB--CoM heterodisulfide reductase iron-sulfur subunit B family protein [Anaerolineales bacterium]